MDLFEEGLSGIGKYGVSSSTIEQRSNSATSEATGRLEGLPAGSPAEKRRRHIVRSGGRKGVEIITGYKENDTLATPTLAVKRPWEDVTSRQAQSEEALAQAAVERLSARCNYILKVHAEAKHRKAQNSLYVNDLPYASSEYLLDSVLQATMHFLDDKGKIEEARRSAYSRVPALCTPQMQTPVINSTAHLNRQQLLPYSQDQHCAAHERNIRSCQRDVEPFLPEQLWKDALVDEAWNSHSLEGFSGSLEDLLPNIEHSQQLPWL